MTTQLLICTDLDRTLIPNGSEPESAGARQAFKQLCCFQDVVLVYVTGRDQSLVEQAIGTYDLPQPDFVIADVGATIYQLAEAATWQQWTSWAEQISPDWNGYTTDQLLQQFAEWPGLRKQEPAKQQQFKASFYVELVENRTSLIEQMESHLCKLQINANLIWSVDEALGVGLLDLLPAAAGKYPAIDFLRRHLKLSLTEVLFAGDSGNDLDVMVSPIPSVLVANAKPEVLNEALQRISESELGSAFYAAKGGFMGMNGCYSAGILEGVAHYYPELSDRLNRVNGTDLTGGEV
jgi:sucrose-6F-phosphate phosphohydrolase